VVLIYQKAVIELEANHKPVPELKLKLVVAVYFILTYIFESRLRLNLLGT